MHRLFVPQGMALQRGIGYHAHCYSARLVKGVILFRNKGHASDMNKERSAAADQRYDEYPFVARKNNYFFPRQHQSSGQVTFCTALQYSMDTFVQLNLSHATSSRNGLF
jgi:hypothetical protein